jgi:hypothetical protein
VRAEDVERLSPYAMQHLKRFGEFPENFRTTGGCQINVAADLELRSGLLQRIVHCLLPTTINDVVAAIEARAHTIYSGPKGRGHLTRREPPEILR